jgi:hypothetical protein
MLPRAFPGIIVVFASLLHNNAYAQRREQAPQNGALSKCVSSELAFSSRRASSLRLVSPNEGAVSDLNVLMDVQPCPFSRPNDTGENPATYLRHNLRMDRSSLDYARVARSFFAISSEREGVILYSRCNFSRRAIHCFDLTYPQEEKRAWDAVVTRISLSLRPLAG